MRRLLWFFVLLPALARAESLEDAARREHARREKNQKAGVESRVVRPEEVRTFIGDDGSSDGAESGSSTGPSNDGGKRKATTDRAVDDVAAWKAKAAGWEQRVSAARADVAAAEEACRDAENDVKRGWDGDANSAQTMMDIVQGGNALEAARKQLEDAKKAVDDVIEQARRDGISID